MSKFKKIEDLEESLFANGPEKSATIVKKLLRQKKDYFGRH